MIYYRTLEVEGWEKANGGYMLTDLHKQNGNANVAVTMGYAYPYGKGKCSVTVSLKCDQDENTIDKAASLAMCKADDLAQEGMRVIQAYLENGELGE